MLSDLAVDDAKNLTARLRGVFEADVKASLAARGTFAVGLSGGSVATAFFPPLAALALDWSRVDFFWIDERAVPVDDPESNCGAARTLWLRPAGVPEARIHPMPADRLPLDAAAEAYSAELVQALGTPPQLDVALVGVGPDGHVASLFPGHPLLDEEALWVAGVDDSPKPPPRRLTLTLPTLAAARHVIVIALGEGKAGVLREAVEDPQSALPVARLVRRAPRVTVLLDPAAASRLSRP